MTDVFDKMRDDIDSFIRDGKHFDKSQIKEPGDFGKVNKIVKEKDKK